MKETSNYHLEITPKSSIFKLNLKELWNYKDLLFLFVRRDFVAVYKQTVLGPLWFVIQPILTSVMQLLIFTKVAKLSVDGMPPILFYLSGNIMWQYFAGCLTVTSNTFRGNAGIFGKVYFPRLILPMSLVISQLLKFGIQFGLFLVVWVWFLSGNKTNVSINPNSFMLLLPLLVMMMAALSLGLGMIISSLTTKYRDFSFLLGFVVQLAMYASVVILPLSAVPQQYRWIILANPMTAIIETFRHAFMGTGVINWLYLGYSFGFMLVVLSIGVIVFNKVEKTFMDTV
ncbi:ABC transporter permease [Mangrovimonas sp. TPBH4]|uniref:ABC transporter permease n=1 Tax=Mangrovimonas sp. TPBH4 TaxID=1645914 RepID=UPI0006B5266C|nr:ABC transporter permease [Mangrovimonas sp. TPBH4]